MSTAAAERVTELRIRAQSMPEPLSPRHASKKRIGQITVNAAGLLMAFYLIGVLLVEMPSSEMPHILLGAAISIVALMPMCMGVKQEEEEASPV